MNHLFFTLLAYFLNSLAVTIDKFLLIKAVPNPLAYVFYISLASLLALLILPLTHLPQNQVIILASASTILWSLGAYCMFAGLKVGQISRVIPVIGTLTPLFLLLYASQTQSISLNEIWAAGILILGLIFITANSFLGRINRQELILEILSALFFATSYLVLKQAYFKENFLTVLAYSRLILIPLGLVILLIPKLKRQIFQNQKPQFKLFPGRLFVLGQILGGSAQILLTFSISLANPALVNSMQGTQYVFLYVFALILSQKYPQIFKEKATSFLVVAKILGIFLIFLGLALLAFSSKVKTSVSLGVTYSPRYAFELGLEPKMTFLKILDQLGVQRVRIPIYWDEVEKFPHQLSFSYLDYYLAEALKRQVKVILVLGYKQPRWPECFAPLWVKDLIRQDLETRILQLLEKEVSYFKNYPHIYLWQIENEPFLSFGFCNRISKDQKITFLKKEVELVHRLDLRPILLTDSGELSSWMDTLQLSDWFGTTIYRNVWSSWFDSATYPLPPAFYTIKEKFVRVLTNHHGPTIISELQAEPWPKDRKRLDELTIDQQIQLMPTEKLIQNINFAKETGFSEIYLWGVEWWYFMASHGHPEYLDYAKRLFIDQ